MDTKIQLSKPEFTEFSVGVKVLCSFPSQSGYKMVSEWMNYFITLRSVHPKAKEDYGMCLNILRHASFCEGLYAEVTHGEDNTGKYLKLTLHFPNMDCLNKFISEFEEKVNNNSIL